MRPFFYNTTIFVKYKIFHEECQLQIVTFFCKRECKLSPSLVYIIAFLATSRSLILSISTAISTQSQITAFAFKKSSRER